MDKECNQDKYYVKPIEYCSLKALNSINNYIVDPVYNYDNNRIFSQALLTKLTDFNAKFRDNQTDNNFVFKYEGENETKVRNLCEKTNKIEEYYENCVLKTKNPLFTYKDGYCIVSPDIILPPELKKIEEKNEIIIKIGRAHV
jgi:hypothetical protein